MGINEGERLKERKTHTVTFRVDSSTVDELQREADAREVSLNVLVNQILKRYSDWGRYEDKISMMPVPKSMIRCLMDTAITLADENGIKIIDHYREQMVKRAAQTAFDTMKDVALFMKKQYNLWSVLSLLEDYMRVSGINADHQIRELKHTFVIQHDLGTNWSLFTKELLTLIFEKLANVRVEASMTANTTVAVVLLR